ncbi:MAG: MFS transporter [Alphaproteobacteria bacterium]
MAQSTSEPISRRLQFAVYMCGICSNGTSSLVWVITPLWVVELGASPFMIGISLGSYTVLPLLLSIHGGALMDKLGARRVIMFFGTIVVIMPWFYPISPWIPAVIVLQMILGLSVSMGWIGTQTLIGQRMRGDPTYSGRLAFWTRSVGLAGPPLIGLAWDNVGPWGAFAFMSFWASGALVGVFLLPKLAAEETAAAARTTRVRDLMPKPGDYMVAFRLLAIPTILLVVVMSVLRQSAQGIQSSFYVVYLENINFSATEIGILTSSFLAFSAMGALTAAKLVRLFSPAWLLVVAVTVSVIMITITPLLGAFFLLMVAISVRGGVLGIVQPLMLTMVLKAADAKVQGKAVALRASANRLAMTFIPVIMGAVIEVVGLDAAFFVIGGILMVLMAIVSLIISRSPSYRDG